MAVDAYFDQDQSTALKSIPEEHHLKVVDDEFDNDDEDEDQEISLDSFTGMMGQTGFLLDGAVPAADFTDLIAKLVAGDAKAIEEYDY